MKEFEHIYLTGDTHGDFRDLIGKTIRYGITERDLLIILGDVGINYYAGKKDVRTKDELAYIPATILCIHGNHELRPTSAEVKEKYRAIQWMGDNAYVEDAYPKFIMAADGARYHINDRDFFIIGGAYSVDKYWRLQWGYRWFSDEQLTAEEMDAIRRKVEVHGNREDIILAHTCPYDCRPVEEFISGVDQSTVDNTMEHFLQEIVDTTDYNAFYCGHWHTEKQFGKVRFMFHDVIQMEETRGVEKNG